ncbi:MAG: cadherin-like domain-containing protein, partial [Betaproteobacteria bacterium]
RFLPAANYSGTPGGLSVRLADGSGGDVAFSTSADISAVIGGTGKWSAATVPLGTSITTVNDAPTLDASKSPALAAVSEDAPAPTGLGAVGTLVSTLVGSDNVTDPDASALTGIAITDADATNGTWWYSTNGGSSWDTLGAASNTGARLLNADASTRVYFQPNANFHGTLSNALTFRAWDRTSGTNGGTADTSTNGDSSAFSTATDTASLVVYKVNHPPEQVGTLQATMDEGSSAVLTSTMLQAQDDEDAGVNLTYTLSASPAHGTIRRNGITLGQNGTFTQRDVDDGLVVYEHDGSEMTTDGFTLQLRDSAGAGTGPLTFTLTLTPVDDPFHLEGTTLVLAEQGSSAITSAMLYTTDVDDRARPVSFQVTNVTGGFFARTGDPVTSIDTFGETEVAAGTILFVMAGDGSQPGFDVQATDGLVTTAWMKGEVRISSSFPDDVMATIIGMASAPGNPPPDAPPTAPAPPATAPQPSTRDSASPSPGTASAGDRMVMTMSVPRTPTASKTTKTSNTQSKPGEGDAEGAPMDPAEANRTVVVNNAAGAAAVLASATTPGPAGATAGSSDSTKPALLTLPTTAGTASGTAARIDPAAPLTLDERVLTAVRQTLRSGAMLGTMKSVEEKLAEQEKFDTVVVGSSAAVASSLSVGYLTWLMRGGTLVSSLLVSLPAWRALDPLPVLGRPKDRADDEDEDDDDDNPKDPLEQLFLRARSALNRGRRGADKDSEPVE